MKPGSQRYEREETSSAFPQARGEATVSETGGCSRCPCPETKSLRSVTLDDPAIVMILLSSSSIVMLPFVDAITTA